MLLVLLRVPLRPMGRPALRHRQAKSKRRTVRGCLILRNQLHGGKQVDKDVYELPAQRPSSNSLVFEDSAVAKHILLTLE